ncbi:nitric oxide-associated protein 1 [Cimex lectularius]|uniref:G domain-containing protein n=1 Tax=Cimex lectularius TaxID=79782 RepID=A0A8I6S0G5_CIMLE|nr:nitric oxide-associated protein 1 [Cimex lectularius]
MSRYLISDGVRTYLFRTFILKEKLKRYSKVCISQKGVVLNSSGCRFYSTKTDSAQPEECFENKIIYNSVINKYNFIQRKMLEKHSEEEPVEVSSYALRLISDDMKCDENKEEDCEETDQVRFPFSSDILNTKVSVHDVEERSEDIDWDSENWRTQSVVPLNARGKKWMNDYEQYTLDETEETDFGDWNLNYGTCNPNVPVSKVPCGGCGAYLHCQDFSIPGYLPYEIFKKCTDVNLRSITCQRCHFFTNYNAALSVTVDPDSYPTLISKIKNEKAMVLLMVDLTDFPCSIWPGLLDLIGKKRPIFLVGNKVDLLWGDSKGWFNHVQEVLRKALPREARVEHVQLISAKTGFGVEELITKLHNVWRYKGDVYLVGCTNVGKSTLFNSLLQSDYCKVRARDFVQRATTSPWPGTTLNLLKFPIMNPEGWRLYLRTIRLLQDKKQIHKEKKLRKEQIQSLRMKLQTPPQLIGHIGKTFYASKTMGGSADGFSIANREEMKDAVIPQSGLDPDDKNLQKSRWVYDTPGVLHDAQNLDLLTTEEIVQVLPKEMIEPRSFLLKPEWTLFVGGMARLDFISGNTFMRCTVFSSKYLPVTICLTSNAEEVYENLVGTDKMGIPIGRGERLTKWPGLAKGKETTFCGLSKYESCADIVLSSCGWVSITPNDKEMCTLLPWTPQARGIYVRIPALLPHVVNQRGKRISKLPAYQRTKPNYLLF